MSKLKDWIIKKLGGYTDDDLDDIVVVANREWNARIKEKDNKIDALKAQIAEYENGAQFEPVKVLQFERVRPITLCAEGIYSKDHPDWAIDHLCHDLASSEDFKNCVNIEILPNPYPNPRDYSVKYRATVQVAPKM